MAEPFAVAPLEAIEFLRQKLNVPTARWTDVFEAQHDKAFTVAGAQSAALLKDFREAVDRNLAEGRTLEQFRADFDAIVATHGWSYHGSRNWRSRLIFQVNLRTAYAAGRWAQIERVKAQRPWLRYVAVMDERTRPLHRAWHDTILPVDHPWWETHFPPNGWQCRCSVQSLSDRDLKRFNLSPSAGAPDSPLVERTINTGSGPKTIAVPEGIDPGFGYHPGRAAANAAKEAAAAKAEAEAAAKLKAEKLSAAAKKGAATKAAKKLKEAAKKAQAEKAAAEEAAAEALAASGVKPPPAAAHGGDFNQAIGMEGKFAAAYGFSSTQLGKGLADVPGPANVKANFKALEAAFAKWKATGVLPKPGEIMPAPVPGAPPMRDPALGHVMSGSTSVMAAPRSTAVWAPVSERAAATRQAEATRVAPERLSPDQARELEYYKGSGFSSWNADLRGGGPSGPYATRTATLDAAFETLGYDLPADMHLVRDTGYFSGIDSVQDALNHKGLVIADQAYFSTTAKRVGAGFGSSQHRPPAPKVRFVIRAKAGQRVLPGVAKGEQEFIFARGTRWRVLDVEPTEGGRRVDILLEPA